MVAENLANVKKHVRPPLRHMLISHITQHNTLRQSIDRPEEWQFCLTKHKLYIVNILEWRVFILLFIFLNCVVECVTCSWSNSRWNGVDFTKHLYGHRASRRISRSKNSKLNLVSLQVSSRCRGYSLLSFQNSEFLFSSLFCINFVVVSLTCSAFPHEMVLILSTLRPWDE